MLSVMVLNLMDFKLLDAGDFYKLEKVGPYVFHRPSPAAVWPADKQNPNYNKVDAKYERYQNGKGKWFVNNKSMSESFEIEILDLKLQMQLTSFGHLGVFAEQFKNWKRLKALVKQGDRVLNLFAYTGVASLIAAANDAEVVHVDASKTSVSWARKNQELSGLNDKKIRWIVDDVRKFVAREVRRESQYDWIVLDPPSFGRGTQKEAWIIEEHLNPLIKDLAKLKSQEFKAILLSSHSPGYSPLALDNILTSQGFNERFSLKGEMSIEHESTPLPSGYAAWRSSLQID